MICALNVVSSQVDTVRVAARAGVTVTALPSRESNRAKMIIKLNGRDGILNFSKQML